MLNVNIRYCTRKFLGIGVTKQGNQFFNTILIKELILRSSILLDEGEIEDNDRELTFDGRAILNGYASITPIGYNMTNESYIPDLERNC